MKELNRDKNEMNYTAPEIAWSIIGAVVFIIYSEVIFWLGYISAIK